MVRGGITYAIAYSECQGIAIFAQGSMADTTYVWRSADKTLPDPCWDRPVAEIGRPIMVSTEKTTRRSDSEQALAAPFIALPKSGGAIRGMGEKFAANPVIGTGSMAVPIATSPGRSGFGPELTLSYDSGAGNGPFGIGWNLSLPSITRKTDKGLPRYRDGEESDVFIL